MKNFPINNRLYHNLLFLLDNYTDNSIPPTDYVKMMQKKALVQEEHYEFLIEMFLHLIQYRELFSDFIEYFYCLGKRKDHSDKHSLMVFTYILIAILKVTNKDEIIEVLKEEKCLRVINFLRFFNRESIIERLFLMGCQYFDEKYIRENIILNIKKNKEISEEIQIYFEGMLVQQKAEYTREPTKPVTPRITPMMRQGPPPPVPVNTPEEVILPSVKPVPASTYKQPKINEVLTNIKRENRIASLQLLEEASEATKRLSNIESHGHHSCSLHSDESIPKQKSSQQKKADKCHSKAVNTIPVKKNAATILREAARLIKEEEQDIKRMNELVCGAADHSTYEEMLDQLRLEEEQLSLQDIERKHLLGQLTREEAILARRRLLDANRARRAQIEKEKKETEEILKEMRQKQEEEIRQIIEKTQQIQKNIETKKQDIIHKKQMEAQEVASTSKQLYAEAMMRQKQELEKRIEIIKEIKALSNIRDLQSNKFDPTETMNVGLLCEMSLVELHERLLLKRTRIKEEIENRQRYIKKQKLKQKQFLADTQQFIDTCREQKKLISETKDSAYKHLKRIKGDNKEVLELREKLERARQKRMELTKS